MTRWRPVAVDAGLVALASLDAVLSAGYTAGQSFAVSLVAALALAVRRRWPYISFALVLPALVTAYVLIAPLTALYTVAAQARSRRAIAACAVLTGLGYIMPWPPTGLSWLGNYLGLIYACVFAGAPVALGLLTQTRRQLADRLTDLARGQQREQQLIAERVLARERTRLAREMHDVVSHQVSLISVQAGALRTSQEDGPVREAADTIRGLSVQTLQELRHMVEVLRASDGRELDLAPQPRLADIPRLVQDSGHNATVDLDGAADRDWPDAIQRAAYRTVQEALTNIGKHAPDAPVTVTLAPSGTDLRVTIRNEPPATPPAPAPPGGGHGLVGLHERAHTLGGTLHAAPTNNGGFLVEATFSAGPES